MQKIEVHADRIRIGLVAALGLVVLTAGCSAKPAESEVEESAEAAETTEASAAATSDVDAALASIDAFVAAQKVDKTQPNWKLNLAKPEMATFDPARTYFWHLNTNLGDIKIRLMPDVAPMHVTSTIYLTRHGFYDDVSFHRVITGFMAQGGDPTGTGGGGPGYKYAGEFSASVKHDRPGLLSMANAGAGTDGSQFFLTFVPTAHLNGKHTIFGEVVDGMGTVKALEARGSRSGATKEPLGIVTATISVE